MVARLIRHGKCVLFGASTPRRYCAEEESNAGSSAFDATVPADFPFPISLDLIKDHVVVTSGQIYDCESIGLGIDDAKLKAEEAVVLRARRVQSRPQGEKQRSWCNGETSLGGSHRRILLSDDTEVEQMQAAIRKGDLMITTPRKGMEKKDYDSSIDHSRAEQF